MVCSSQGHVVTIIYCKYCAAVVDVSLDPIEVSENFPLLRLRKFQ